MNKNGKTLRNYQYLIGVGIPTNAIFVITCIIALILFLSGCAEDSSMDEGKTLTDSNTFSMEESSGINITEQPGKSSAPSHTYTAGTDGNTQSDSHILKENGIIIKKERMLQQYNFKTARILFSKYPQEIQRDC